MGRILQNVLLRPEGKIRVFFNLDDLETHTVAVSLKLSVVPLMDIEVPLGAQALPTLGADDRAPTEVYLLVGQQCGALPKAPAAVGTFEGLLPLVDLPGNSEGPLLHEALPTLSAGEWPLLRVRPRVDIEVGLCAQALAAAGAEIGTTLGVCLLVGGKTYLQTEAAPTLPAAEGPLSCVDALVGCEVAPGGEAPPTLPASEELISCVDPLVSLEVSPLAEGFATLLTRVVL